MAIDGSATRPEEAAKGLVVVAATVLGTTIKPQRTHSPVSRNGSMLRQIRLVIDVTITAPCAKQAHNGFTFSAGNWAPRPRVNSSTLVATWSPAWVASRWLVIHRGTAAQNAPVTAIQTNRRSRHESASIGPANSISCNDACVSFWASIGRRDPAPWSPTAGPLWSAAQAPKSPPSPTSFAGSSWKQTDANTAAPARPVCPWPPHPAHSTQRSPPCARHETPRQPRPPQRTLPSG